jgi:hypothetical protein
LPLVINTAYGQYRDNFHTWGADAFVVKSSNLAELKSVLKKIAPGRYGASQCAQENRPPPAKNGKVLQNFPPWQQAALAPQIYGRKGPPAGSAKAV